VNQLHFRNGRWLHSRAHVAVCTERASCRVCRFHLVGCVEDNQYRASRFFEFSIYEAWCRTLHDRDLVLTVDVRDSFVQKNPFSESYLRLVRDVDISLFSEAQKLTIGQNSWNSGWVICLEQQIQ